MAKSESNIEKDIVKWCEGRKYLCLKLALISKRGFPDRTILMPGGRIVFVEVKEPSRGKMSPHQFWWKEILESFGQIVIEARSLDDVIAVCG